jgi:hypothetical protein
MSKTAQANQPPPLPQSIVVGLNAWNAKSKISNANFECLLNEQVNVNNGDSIFVKASYLDTRGTASNNIVLPRDTEISLEYYFYWIHTFNACDPKGITTFSADDKTELTQQVLVGLNIQQQFNINKVVSPTLPQPVLGYFTKFNTDINNADGLPYLVYQSADNVPVPAVVGPSIRSSLITANNTYLINSQGLTTDWEYAGVPGAVGNKLPAGWVLNQSTFNATANPEVSVPPLAFITPAQAAPLPYVEYVITAVGNTNWEAIDPTLLGPAVPATSIENGLTYTIADPGDLDWTVWGAADSNALTTFVANTTTYSPPPIFPITLSNAFFQTNAALYTGGLPFTSSDVCNAVIRLDQDGSYKIQSITGSGNWLSDVDNSFWNIPPDLFGLSASTPTATALEISDFVSIPTSSSLTQLVVGQTYTISQYGTPIDPCVPAFSWNLVGNFPSLTTDTAVVGTSYQVTENNCFLINATYNGVVGDFVIPTHPIVIPTQYNVTPNDVQYNWLFYDAIGTPIPVGVPQTHTLHLDPDPDNDNIPVWTEGRVDFPGTPFAAALDAGEFIYIKIYDPNSTLQTANWLFVTQDFTDNQINSAGCIDNNSWFDSTVTFNQVWASPSKLILLDKTNTNQTFVATASFTPTSGGTAATVVPTFSLLTAVADGMGYIDGTAYQGAKATVGTVIKAINPDPAGGQDSGGRATVSPLQYGSTTPYEFSGYVNAYTPPTTRTIVEPVKKKWKMTLKAGSYDPNNLAEIISRSMSRQRTKRVNNVQGGPFGTQSSLTVPTDNIWNNTPNGDVWAQPTGLGSNTFYDSKNLNTYANPSDPNYNIDPDNDDMPFLFVPAMNGTPLHATSPDNANDYIYAQIPHPNGNGLNAGLDEARYYVSLVPLLSDVRSVSPNIPSTVSTDGYYSILPFYSQNSITNATPDTGVSGIFPIAFGATQTSLLYNNENNSLFSFNYLHSPILAFLSSTSSELTEATAHMYSTQNKSTNMTATSFFTTQVDKKSGILLNKMNPPEFWAALGFDVPSLTVDLDDPTQIGFQMTLDDFNKRTTGGFSGASNIFNQTYHTKGSSEQPSVPDTELIYLQAIPTPINPIQATTPNLVIGTSYTILSSGRVTPTGEYTNDWSSVGGPNIDDQESDVVSGSVFIATSTGFDPITPPFPFQSGYSWLDFPQVIPSSAPTTTTTQLQNTYFQVSNTNSLNAVTIPLSQDSAGHFLVEITGYNSIYLDESSKREIKSIISSYYVTSGSFTSQPFPDSYNFFNYGSPISLSNIKVRILDPITREEVIGLGPNSSVYLQINKLLTEQAVAQVEN